MGYIKIMQTVAETPTFTKQAARLLSEQEKDYVINYLAANPEEGDRIPGTGGIRKLRIGIVGKGKRSSARVVYYFFNETVPIYALSVYGKGQRTDLTPDDRKAATAFVTAMKATLRRRK